MVLCITQTIPIPSQPLGGPSLLLSSASCPSAIRRVAQRHKRSAPLWGTAAGMLVVATCLPARQELAVDLARWSIFIALAAGFVMCADLTTHIIHRLTQIVALWAEDVLGDDLVPHQRDHDDATTESDLRKLADIARARRRRAARRALPRREGL